MSNDNNPINPLGNMQTLCICTDMGYWRWAANSDHLLVDNKILKMFGYKVNEKYLSLKMENWLDIIHKDDYQKWQKILNLKSDLKGSIISIEQHLLTKDKGYKPFLVEVHLKDEYNLTMEGTVSETNIKRFVNEQFIRSGNVDNTTQLFMYQEFYRFLNTICTKQYFAVSIIVGDINGLREINKIYGHDAGDKVLQHVAQSFAKAANRRTIVFRTGEDEFAMALPNTDKTTAVEICKKIEAYVSDCEYNVSVAIGCVTTSELGKMAEKIVDEAYCKMDIHKLWQKGSRKNRVIESADNFLTEIDMEKKNHTARMLEISKRFSKQLNMNFYDSDRLKLLAKFHDLGEIRVPLSILNKPGSLTENEYTVIKNHVTDGYRIASETPFLQSIAKEILYHHENYDASGYPQGLSGKNIPYLSAIVRIIDSYDIMTNGCCYKKAISRQEAKSELEKCSGRQFDPDLLRYFFAIIEA